VAEAEPESGQRRMAPELSLRRTLRSIQITHRAMQILPRARS